MPRPDEGLIHAWLDGQLPPDEAARVEQLAATDPEWAAAVAEARGLVAASSRILAALDHVPSGVMPKQTVKQQRRVLPWWTKVAAALVVMVGGSVIVLRETPDKPATLATTEQKPSAPVPSKVTPPAVPAPTAAPPRATKPEPSARMTQDAVRPAPNAGAVAAAPTRDAAVAVQAKEAAGTERAARERELSTAVAAKGAPAPEALAAPSSETAKNTVQAQRVTSVGGVTGGTAAALRAEARQAPICYRLMPDNAPATSAVVMRLVRVSGDTLRLEGASTKSADTAWLVSHATGWRGMMFTRDTVRVAPVTGVLTLCPVP